jgi:hypothetical protein
MSETLPTLLTPCDVASWLALPTSRVERLVRDGAIPCIRLPTGEIVFDAAELAAWLGSLRVRMREVRHAD